MNTDNHGTTSSTTNKYIVRTGGAPVTPLIPVTIFTSYVRPPNELNAVKSLKGTKLEPLRALLALLPEKFTTTIVAQSWVALDLSLKIKQRESSYSQFTKQVVVRDEHGKATTDTESGETITEHYIPLSLGTRIPSAAATASKMTTR